jgi:hypothetical protein
MDGKSGTVGGKSKKKRQVVNLPLVYFQNIVE